MRRLIALLIFILLILFVFYNIQARKRVEKDHLILYGNVDVRQVDLGFRISGKVEKLNYEEGDLVEAGKQMAILDKQPYLDQVRQAQANVESIKASLINSKQVLKRRQELIGSGSISQEDLENASSNVDVLIANLAQSEASLAIAETNLSFTVITAPTDGMVLTRIREPGTIVNPGEPVYTLSISSPVWIRAFVNEPELGLIYPGMPAEIYTDTPGGKTYRGTIGFISPTAEFTPKSVETTRLRTDLVYRIRIYAENPDRSLRQGMPVTIKLPLRKEQQ